MNDHHDMLELFKDRRRTFVDQLALDDDPETAAKLAHIQGCITAIEAVINEQPEARTGPTVEFGADGWPVTLRP